MKWEPLPRGAFDMLTVADEAGTPIAHVAERSEEHFNWRLIAAAPELYALLRRLNAEVPLEREAQSEVADLLRRIES